MSFERLAVLSALGLFLLWRNLAGALLFFWPAWVKVRREEESWPEVDNTLFEQMAKELAPLGFTRLGIHVERSPLRQGTVVYDFGHAGESTWASASMRGDDAELYLLTAFDEGGLVLTADHRRGSVAKEGHYLAGGLPGVEPEQLLAAHRRRVDRMRQAGKKPTSDLSLDARVKRQEEWIHGPGKREVRLKSFNAFLFSVMATAILGGVVVSIIRLLGR